MSVAAHAYALVEVAGEQTAAHGRSVAELAGAVADELGLDAAACQELELAALLHDIGKSAIPDEILQKPSALTVEERSLIETHTAQGESIVAGAEESLAGIARIVRTSHERWDGTGYPDGLAGHSIPLAARVVFCCDSYDAMTTDRPYRKAMSHAGAVSELWAGAGSQFDPIVVAAVARVLYAQQRSGGQRRAGRQVAPVRGRRAQLASVPATS